MNNDSLELHITSRKVIKRTSFLGVIHILRNHQGQGGGGSFGMIMLM